MTRLPIEHRRPDRLTLGAFGAVALLGGANTVAVRICTMELAPFWAAALRFGAASILLLAIAVRLRLVLPRGRALAGAVLFGLTAFSMTNALFYWGLLRVPAGLGQTVMSLVPLMTVLLALAHGVERFRIRAVVGALLAASGIALVFREQVGVAVPLVSLLAFLGAAACTAESGVVVKWFPTSHPVVFNAVAMTVGSLGLLTLSAVAQEPWTLPTLLATQVALSYAVVVGSVGFFLLYVLVYQRWTASAAAYQFLAFPFVAVALGALLAGEPVTPALLVGGPLVLAGVYVGALANGERLAGQFA